MVVPPTRHDILHECDVAEDIAAAYGYNNIKVQFPDALTVAQPLPLNKLTDQLRLNLAAAGWTEVLSFALCSTEDITTKMRKPDQLEDVVKISNPKTIEFQVEMWFGGIHIFQGGENPYECRFWRLKMDWSWKLGFSILGRS